LILKIERCRSGVEVGSKEIFNYELHEFTQISSAKAEWILPQRRGELSKGRKVKKILTGFRNLSGLAMILKLSLELIS
jgi:hypothetical protein